MSQQHADTLLPVSHRGGSEENNSLTPDAMLNKKARTTWAVRIVVLLWFSRFDRADPDCSRARLPTSSLSEFCRNSLSDATTLNVWRSVRICTHPAAVRLLKAGFVSLDTASLSFPASIGIHGFTGAKGWYANCLSVTVAAQREMCEEKCHAENFCARQPDGTTVGFLQASWSRPGSRS